MQTMQITAHLQRAPAFNRLAMRELVRVAEAVDEIQLDSDEILFEAGADRASLYLLISGEISLSLRETEIASVGPGSLIGELASIDGECDFLNRRRSMKAEVKKLFDELHRKIIDAIEIQIFERSHRRALPAPGEPAHKDDPRVRVPQRRSISSRRR